MLKYFIRGSIIETKLNLFRLFCLATSNKHTSLVQYKHVKFWIDPYKVMQSKWVFSVCIKFYLLYCSKVSMASHKYLIVLSLARWKVICTHSSLPFKIKMAKTIIRIICNITYHIPALFIGCGVLERLIVWHCHKSFDDVIAPMTNTSNWVTFVPSRRMKNSWHERHTYLDEDNILGSQRRESQTKQIKCTIYLKRRLWEEEKLSKFVNRRDRYKR